MAAATSNNVPSVDIAAQFRDHQRVIATLDTLINLIRAIRPDVLAKGSDYTVEQVVGAEDVKSWQGEVALIQLVDGKSSTRIVQAIQSVSNPS